MSRRGRSRFHAFRVNGLQQLVKRRRQARELERGEGVVRLIVGLLILLQARLWQHKRYLLFQLQLIVHRMFSLLRTLLDAADCKGGEKALAVLLMFLTGGLLAAVAVPAQGGEGGELLGVRVPLLNTLTQRCINEHSKLLFIDVMSAIKNFKEVRPSLAAVPAYWPA